jgi:glycosyltransferase involved in cell wall biosynthesis
VRVARIIGRLNIGGPAIQAITLTKLLEPRGYHTLLIRGSEASHEGSLDDLAARYGVHPQLIEGLRRELHPADVFALTKLVRALRAFRPQIVHTHLAKAGTLGRAAAILATPGHRPILVHTFHGHSLEGYFSPRKAAVFRGIERALGRRSDRLVAVSKEVADDLVRLRVAPRERIEVIPVGFDLSPFQVDIAQRADRRSSVRDELGIPAGAQLVTLVARLVPIKRVDRFLRIAARVARQTDAYFAVVGDGELREQLRGTPVSDALEERLVWAGFRRDIPDVCFASDVVVLTSDNEGTPVSLIEAQAAAVPVVSTRVGGAATVVQDGTTGRLVARDDDEGFADAVLELLGDPDACRSMGAAGREHVLRTFSLDRLVDDIDALYARLLEERATSPRGEGTPRA